MGMVKSLSAQLKSQLESLAKFQTNRDKMEESKLTLIKGAMQDFVQPCLHGRAGVDIVKVELHELYSKDMVISSDVYQWSLELVDSIAETIPQESHEEVSTDDDVKPLYCKETLYHASLCCSAVSSCTSATYKKFFSEDFPNHTLEEVSFSISTDKDEVDRYLIARQGKILYIAFQSEPYLEDWHDKFESFQQGKLVHWRMNTCRPAVMKGTPCFNCPCVMQVSKFKLHEFQKDSSLIKYMMVIPLYLQVSMIIVIEIMYLCTLL